MMKTRKLRGLVAVTAASTLLLAACGGDEDEGATDEATTEESATDEMSEDEMSEDEMSEDEMSEDEMSEDEMSEGEMEEGEMEEGESSLALEPFGPACSEIPSDGAGSSASMADQPAATAASENPVLETLVQAVQAADLVDTVNSAEALTVFAPANSAFEAFSQEELDALLADQEQLSAVLTTHVVGENLEAAELVETGTFTSLQGAELTVEGSVDAGVTVTSPGATANVVCGNVQTANATVHIIDTVLMPAQG